MRLFEVNEVTKLAEPTAEARTIESFKEIIERSRPIDGDRDGKKKTLNMKELAYIYYMSTYDSRFKLLHGNDKENAVKSLVGLPNKWTPDSSVLKALNDYVDLQTTESTKLVEVLSKSIQSLTKFAETAQEQMGASGLLNAQEVNKFLDILDRIPTTVEGLRKAKEQMNREQDALSKGRKGRIPNKFEMPNT